jgi:small subunit ribosomal protein S8
MTDPISDMLTRIRNASQAMQPAVEMPHSLVKASIAAILRKEGYIAEVASEGDKLKRLKLKLKYEGRRGVIEGLQRVSKPGRRVYVGAADIPRVRGGLGVSILSTSQGVMSGTDARKNKLGGEVLCYIW